MGEINCLKFFIFILLLLSQSTFLLAQHAVLDNDGIMLTPIVGLSQSKLHYSIAGNEDGGSPNILSELIWSKLGAVTYGLELKGYVFKDLRYKIQYMRSDVFVGDVSDIDYAEDNRQGVFSEQYFSSHNGFSNQLNGQVGCVILRRGKSSFTLLLGLDYLHLRAYLLNHKSDDTENIPNDYFEGLNSFYNTKWKSIGVTIWYDYMLSQRLSFLSDFGFYRATYRAYGNWNLNDSFLHPKSYTHQGNSFRISGRIDLCYRLGKLVRTNIGYALGGAVLRNGKDELYLANGRTLRTRLNEVHHHNNVLSASITFKF